MAGQRRGGHTQDNIYNGFKSYMILIAMGMHTFFAGLALGTTADFQKTLSLFIALIAHKWSVSFSVGMCFVQTRVERSRSVLMIFLYSCIILIGVYLGLLCSQNNKMAQVFCMVFSVGTFIYMGTVEIINEEFSVC